MRYTKMETDHCPSCGCSRPEAPKACRISLPVLAFIEPQQWDGVYSEGQALARGTLFPALDKPFMGKGGCCGA